MSVHGHSTPVATQAATGVLDSLGPYRLRAAMLSRTESRRMGAAAPRDISDLAIKGPVPALLLLDPRRAIQSRRSDISITPLGCLDTDEPTDGDELTNPDELTDGDELAAEDAIDEPAPLLAWLHRAERTPRAQLGDPRPHAARTAQLMLEVLAGQRPATALRGVAHPDVIQRLAAASHGFTHQQAERRRLAVRPTVWRVIVSEPRDGIAEATVIIREGRRSRALALRLEGLQGHWTATIAELG